MKLEKVAKLHRNELSALLGLLAAEEVFSYEDAVHSNLVELVYSALGYLFKGEPMEFNDLQVEYFSRMSSILMVDPIINDIDAWNKALKHALSERILNEIMPILEVAHLMSWADGNFVSEELEVYDLVLSQLKLLKLFKNDIVEFCLKSLPAATVKADIAQFSNNSEKAECILSFAWAIANVDADTHKNEIALFNDLGDALDLSKKDRKQIQKKVENKWRYLRDIDNIEELSKLVVYSSGIDDYIKKAVGFDAFKIISNIRIDKRSSKESKKSISERFNSLTLFSKMSLISGPKLNLIDRIVLIMGLVLSEIS